MPRALLMCLNWRVVTALALAGGALFVLAPNLALPALPLLLLAVCPLSMLVMFFMMRGSMGASTSRRNVAPEQDAPLSAGAEQTRAEDRP